MNGAARTAGPPVAEEEAAAQRGLGVREHEEHLAALREEEERFREEEYALFSFLYFLFPRVYI